MIKTNLPVIILRGIVLLPNNDIRLEFDNDDSKNVIDVSEMFHDNELLVVSQINPLEEKPEIDELPSIGVISKISHKMELPNGKIRLTITGIKRAAVHEYLNLNRNDEVLESIISKISINDINEEENSIIIRKLYHELEGYIKLVPYISNSLLEQIKNVNDLDKLTDIVAPSIADSLDRVHKYLNTPNPKERAELILEDIYKQEEMFKIERELDSKVRNEMETVQKEYLLKEKIKLIKEQLGDKDTKDDEIDNLKSRANLLDAPDKIKDRLIKEIKKFETLTPMSPEINISKSYIDWLFDLPWGIYTKDNDKLYDVKKILDESHYGLEKVKIRIIEYLAVKQMSDDINGPILCLVGPPGVGKTTLAISIAKAIKRNFVKMAVGGINDGAEIMGHRRTYIGSMPGRIISSLKKAKSFNPLFLIDEIDKMTNSYKEDPASALLEVLDPEQNKYFVDRYIEEEIDLSKIMFITTANYIENIPEALRDRLEIVEISGYTEYEKVDIAKKHLIPKNLKNNGIKTNKISIDDDAILKIIREYTREAGVRELERNISTIFRKIVTSFVIKGKKITKKIIIKDDIELYLGKAKYHYFYQNTKPQIGIVNGLAYTTFGGDTLPIEVNYFKGNGDLVLTGSLGDVMKESARIALSYIKANHKLFNIDYDKLINNDIHIHVPEGAIPKDGPSAGIALTTCLISSFTNLKIDNNLAMTGEITLRGNVLAIGGLKEKSIGAARNNIKRIIIPYDNLHDLDDIPKEIKDNIEYIPVKNYNEIFKIIKEKE